jgi:hypothetical protein
MGFEPGAIIAIAAVLLFYLRLIILQRRKSKQASSTRKSVKTKKSQNSQSFPAAAGPARLEFHRPYLVAAGVLIIILGAALTAVPGLDERIRDWWWLPVTLGILLMSFGIR